MSRLQFFTAISVMFVSVFLLAYAFRGGPPGNKNDAYAKKIQTIIACILLIVIIILSWVIIAQ